MDKKVVVIYSGGLDSTVLLTQCKQEFSEVAALNFSYGSKHNWAERQAARIITKKLRIPYYEYDIPTTCEVKEPGRFTYTDDFLKSNLLKSGGDVPDGDYDADNMKSTVVPLRNPIMMCLAAGFAWSRGFDFIAIANHSGDHETYPDCTPEFIMAFQNMVYRASDGNVLIHAPFTMMTKAEIVKLGSEIGAPLELTWSCYKGRKKHCGLCGTDIERIKAFKLAGFIDPVEYEIEVDWTGCRRIENASP